MSISCPSPTPLLVPNSWLTRRLFIIQGAATGVVALCAYPFLPDSPLNTRWLSEEERTFAHERLLRDKVDQYEKGSTMAGLKQAVSDPRVWIFCLMQNMHLVSHVSWSHAI